MLMGDLAICTSSPLTMELPQAAGVVMLSISGFSSLSLLLVSSTATGKRPLTVPTWMKGLCSHETVP